MTRGTEQRKEALYLTITVIGVFERKTAGFLFSWKAGGCM
jgi:hypothetical protein